MIRALIFVIALLAAPAALAHRQHAVLTSVEHNPRSGKIEIVHRIHGEDLEAALAARGVTGDPTSTPEGRSALEAWARASFDLADARGRKLPLAFIGAEPSGLDLFLYFEAPQAKPPLKADARFFFEIFLEQSNTVNLRLPGQRETQTFRAR
jgi:hypothetical protein